MSPDGLGVDDFQLYVLKVMDPPARLLHAALDQLGRTPEDMIAGYEAVSGTVMGAFRCARSAAPPGLRELFTSILSEAFLEEASEADHGVLNHHLPVWPDFVFQMSFNDAGSVLQDAHFSRTRSQPPEEVNEWRFLESELATTFVNIREVDLWGSYASYLAVHRRLNKRFFLRFSWGLLQEITSEGLVEADS
jgi:hypothetical protein